MKVRLLLICICYNCRNEIINFEKFGSEVCDIGPVLLWENFFGICCLDTKYIDVLEVGFVSIFS
jgi:hypothetical protein